MNEKAQFKQLKKVANQIQKEFKKGAEVNEEALPFGLVPMRNIIPPGQSGDSKIEHFEVTKEGAARHNLICAINGNAEMSIVPGHYIRLVVGKDVMMSDAPYEARSNRDIIEGARGNTLIAGLGMGMILVPILRNPKVESVTVVEKNHDVIKLVYKPLMENSPLTNEQKMKLVLVPGDIFEYRPAKDYFDVVYFDIWPTISPKNLDDAAILKRKFRKSLKAGGWMGVWVEKEMLKRRREDRAFIARAQAFRKQMKEKRA